MVPFLRFPAVLYSRPFHFILIAAGTALRLKHYLENRSFWLDETVSAVNIVSRTIPEIFRGQTFAPDVVVPPLGFALAERLMVSIWGNHEWALRFFPLVCGCVSLMLFYRLLKHVARPAVITAALGLFALAEPLIYYAAELKQYSSDVLTALVLYGVFHKAQDSDWDHRWMAGLAVSGALGLWMSNSAAFVLAGFGLTMLGGMIFSRARFSRRAVLATGAFWAMSLFLLSRYSLGRMHGSSALHEMWSSSFLNAPLWTAQGIRWLALSGHALVTDACGLSFPVLVLACAACGGVVLWRRSPVTAAVHLFPVLLVFTAACLRVYPFSGRLILFTVPSVLLLTAEGAAALAQKAGRFRRLAAVCLFVTLYAFPLSRAGYYLIHPRPSEGLRSAMQFYRDHFRPGDFLVMNDQALSPYLYYIGSLGGDPRTSEPQTVQSEGEILRGYFFGQIADSVKLFDGRTVGLYRQAFCSYNGRGIARKFLSNQQPGAMHPVTPVSRLSFLPRGRVWLFLLRPDPQVKTLTLAAFTRRARQLDGYERGKVGVYLYEFE